MRKVVKGVYFDFSVGHEAYTPYMYADTLNLVTTGIGNLIDAGANHGGPNSRERARLNNEISDAAMAPAMRLPWKHRAPGWSSKNPLAGDAASPSEVEAAWVKVKSQNEAVLDFSQRGGGAYAGLTPITLDIEGVKALFNRKLESVNANLAAHYPGYESWPADAQLAILSMSWGMGEAFHPFYRPNHNAPPGPGNVPFYQKFFDAANRRDFATMAATSAFKGGEVGHSPRNFENQIMFNNAAVVEKVGADPDRLFFPGTSGSIKQAIPQIDFTSVVLGTGATGLAGWGLYKLWKASR